VSRAIELLEQEFHCGVRCGWSTEPPNIAEIFIRSVVASITTSQAGWERIAAGELLTRAPGDPKGSHAVLMESYDLEHDWAIGKNSWGHTGTTQERFRFRLDACHSFRGFTTVFFTLDSIAGKTTKTYCPRMIRFRGHLDGHEIDCAYMDSLTAQYDSEFLCEPCPTRSAPMNWIGYDARTYVEIKLKRLN
jgi:hypothetical protein